MRIEHRNNAEFYLMSRNKNKVFTKMSIIHVVLTSLRVLQSLKNKTKQKNKCNATGTMILPAHAVASINFVLLALLKSLAMMTMTERQKRS